MAAEVRRAFVDATVELIPSGGGRFEVECDGVKIFEKSRLGRHQRPGEVVQLLRDRVATA